MNESTDIKTLAAGIQDYASADRAIALMRRRRLQRHAGVVAGAALVTLAGGILVLPDTDSQSPASRGDVCGSGQVRASERQGTALGSSVKLIRRAIGQPAVISLTDGRNVTEGSADSASPDGLWIGTVEDGAYRVTSAVDGRSFQVRPCSPNQTTIMRAVSWSTNSQFLLLSHAPTSTPELYVLNLASGEQRRVLPPANALPMTVLKTGQTIYTTRLQNAPQPMSRALELFRAESTEQIEVQPGELLSSAEYLSTYESPPQVLAAERGEALWIVVYSFGQESGSDQRAVLRVTLDGKVTDRLELRSGDRTVGARASGVLVVARDGGVHLLDSTGRRELAEPAPGDVISAGSL